MVLVKPSNAQNKVKSDQVLKAFSNYLSAFNAFVVKIEAETKIEPTPRDYTMKFSWTLSVKRPSWLGLIQETGLTGLTIVCDGKSLYTYEIAKNRYWLMPAPASYTEILSKERINKQPFSQCKTILLLDSMLSDQPFETISKQYRILPDLESQVLDEQQCHRLKLSNDEMDIDVWIDKGQKPLPRKLVGVVKYSQEQLSMYKGKSPPQVTRIMRFKDWRLNPILGKECFLIKRPPSATKVDLMKEPRGSTSGVPKR